MRFLLENFKITPNTNIMIIGSSGSGKSTAAQKLGQITGLRVVHIDRIYWKPNWEMRDEKEIAQMINREAAIDGWIFEGNHSSTHKVRSEKANIIIFLDTPRYICLFRVIKRSIIGQLQRKLWGYKRPCLADGCDELITWRLIKWVWNFPKKNQRKIANLFATAPANTIKIVIKTPSQLDELLLEVGTLIRP